MFIDCRNAIEECVKVAIDKNIYTSRKKLKLSGESRVAAILFEGDELEKDGSKKIYTDDAGRHKRKRKYKRKLVFNVVLGEYNIETVEEMYDKFMQALPDGIYVDGNYVSITPENADWLDDEDSILKAKCAVQIKVICDGGLYKDTDYGKLSDADIEVEKE